MKKIRLTESELIRLVQQIVSEQPTIANLNTQRQAGNQAAMQRAVKGVLRLVHLHQNHH